MKKTSMILCGIILAFALFSGCNGKQQTIKLVYTNKAESIALTYLAAAIMEDEYTYNIEMKQADESQVFQMLADGEAEIFFAARSHTHRDYINNYGEQIKSLGIVYEDAQNGLAVPDYVDIESIAQLNGAKNKFEGKIIGINAEANIMVQTTEIIDAYDLEFELSSNGKEDMFDMLESAVSKEQYIVLTAWTPHWMFKRWKLKFLEDPLGEYGEPERIEVYTAKDLKDDYIQVGKFLSKYSLKTEELADLMNYINNAESGADLRDISRSWIFANNSLVDSWL